LSEAEKQDKSKRQRKNKRDKSIDQENYQLDIIVVVEEQHVDERLRDLQK
jgi:hypothetical protein